MLLAIAVLAISRGAAAQVPPSSPDTQVAENRSADPSQSEDTASEDLEVEARDETPVAEEIAPVAKLVFTTDAPCSLVVAGTAMGSLEPGLPLEVEVVSLEIQVSATSADVLFARWSEDLELELDETREIMIPMLEAIEEQRKKERREQVFRDTDLGLMWTRRDNARDLTWAVAGSYCEDLTLGGFDNWQLPSLAELESLEAMWSMRILKVADPIALTGCCLWSGTEGADGSVWNLDFRFRRAFESNRSLSFGLRALCRRDMPAAELAEALLAADPKERKRRLKEKRKRLEEKKRRKESKSSNPEESPDESPDGSPGVSANPYSKESENQL